MKDVERVGDKVVFTDPETGEVDERKIIAAHERLDGKWFEVPIPASNVGKSPL